MAESTIMRQYLWMLAASGAAAIAFGLLALLWPALTLAIFIFLFGIYALVDGVLALAAMFRAINAHTVWWPYLAVGLLGIGAGIAAFVYPSMTAVVLLYIIATWAMAVGLVQIVSAIIQSQWMPAVLGAVSVVFGLLLFTNPTGGALALVLVIGFVILLWALSWTMGWFAFLTNPDFAQNYLASQGVANVTAFFNAAMSRRFISIGGLLTLVIILISAVAFLTANNRPRIAEEQPPTISEPLSAFHFPPATFVFLLIALASILVIAPEFVYLRDQFGTRMNTIFKFYYQAWLLWSIAAAFGTAVLLQNLRGAWDWVFRVGLVVLLFVSLTYPALAIPNKTNNFNPPLGWTLNDFARIQQSNPDEAAGIEWLRSAPYGVVAEAVGGGYTSYGRISTYTGLPTVLDWYDHESQWRGTSAPQGTREADIKLLYSTSNWQTALEILKRYNIRYVYIGNLERSTYPVQEEKFRSNLIQVFKQGAVTIYEVP